MPEEALKRETAKAEYVKRMRNGDRFTLQELADSLNVSRSTIARWKKQDRWEDAVKKKARGGQKGNQHSKGHKNAEKDGAYSTIDLGQLSETETALVRKVPIASRSALKDEMKVLKLRERRILDRLIHYEKLDEETPDMLFLTTTSDTVDPTSGEVVEMRNRDTPFARMIKLQAALDKVQGRIAKIAETLRTIEENNRRFKLETEKVALMRMRLTGSVELIEGDVIVDALPGELPEEDPEELPEGVS